MSGTSEFLPYEQNGNLLASAYKKIHLLSDEKWPFIVTNFGIKLKISYEISCRLI